jgi:hypothetical protein
MVVEVCGGLDVPVNGRSARADAAVPDQDVIEPPASPPERRTKAHFWSPAPRAESRPESSTLAEPEATAARDRRRMFDFF